MKYTASSQKIRQIVVDVREARLLPRPAFQRRLVWTNEDKWFFIDSILRGFPFPEIYMANGEIDTETGEGTRQIVDGQQRVTTICEFFSGVLSAGPNGGHRSYSELLDSERRQFLDYDVVVRDLGDASIDTIKEIFKRINKTSYNLNDMEINNAIYGGALKEFCVSISENEFFEAYRIFRPQQLRRMGDVKYILSIVVTMIDGYFNRDKGLEEYLERYNDGFPHASELQRRFEASLYAIWSAGFDQKSRAFKQADFFTLIVELDRLIVEGDADIALALANIGRFFAEVDSSEGEKPEDPRFQYRQAVLQAANDRGNRVLRGDILRRAMLGQLHS
jgi:hypothetical protein